MRRGWAYLLISGHPFACKAKAANRGGDGEQGGAEEKGGGAIKTHDGASWDGYPCTGYEFVGQKCHDVTYLGEYEDGGIPKNDRELASMRLGKLGLQATRPPLSAGGGTRCGAPRPPSCRPCG